MTPPRRLFLAVLLALCAGSAAAQGVKIAGAPAAPAKADVPKKGDGKPKKKAAAPKGKKKKKAAAESRYKTRILAEDGETSYRFDEDGNPIDAAKKKKAGAKAKKSSEPSEGKAACAADQPCSEKGGKSSDADSL
jgi:hypothetical protein